MRASTAVVLSAMLGYALLTPPGAGADMYRYVDEQGRHHIVTHPSEIPPRYREGASHRSSTPERAAESAPADEPPAGEPAPAPGEPSDAVVVPTLDPSAGHVVLEVVLNGSVRQKMIVDTGASITVVPMSTARRLGMSLRPPYTGIVVQTASGSAVFPVAHLRSVEVGEASVGEMPVVFNDFMGDVGLLGVDFLSEFDYGFEGGGLTLTLEPKDTTPRPGFYGGRAEAWWRERFTRLQATRRDLKQMRAELTSGTRDADKDEVMSSGAFAGLSLRDVFSQLDMSIRFWEREIRRAEREANAAGLPYALR